MSVWGFGRGRREMEMEMDDEGLEGLWDVGVMIFFFFRGLEGWMVWGFRECIYASFFWVYLMD